MDQFNFNSFPETNFNEVNLSWMLEVMTQFKEDLESGQFVGPQGPQGPQGVPGPAGDGLTEEVKQALLQLAQKVAYIDAGGQTYYQDLYNALYGVTPAELVSISAVYTQSGPVYDTDSLESLKADLIVTATYSDSSTAVIPAADYILSGSLTVGTSTITVSYSGKTDTFQVTVTASAVTLVSISAAFNQGSAVIYESDSLDSLKQYLVVTATYSDSTTATIPSTDYTLSGTLTEGTSTITVSYQGKTTTFQVTVTASVRTLIHAWDFTTSLADTVGSVTAVLGSGATRDISGVHLTAAKTNQRVTLPGVLGANIEVEVDVAVADFKNTGKNGRFIMFDSGNGFCYRSSGKWQAYTGSWDTSSVIVTDPNIFNGQTALLTVDSSSIPTLSVKGGGLIADGATSVSSYSDIIIGSADFAFYDLTVTAVRIYQGG